MVKEEWKHRHIYKTTIGNSIIQSLQQLDNILCLLSLGKKKKKSALTYDYFYGRSSYLPVLAEIYKPDGNIHPSRSFVPICARGLFLAVQVSQTLLIQGGRRKGTAGS